jgi:hypothetical protein
MLLGARILFVVEIVQQPGRAPQLLIRPELAGVGPHDGLDRVTMLAQAIAFDVLVQQRQRRVSINH